LASWSLYSKKINAAKQNNKRQGVVVNSISVLPLLLVTSGTRTALHASDKLLLLGGALHLLCVDFYEFIKAGRTSTRWGIIVGGGGKVDLRFG